MFLTKQEIEILTGYKYKSAQIRWLNRNKFQYVLTFDGYPRVLVSHVETLLNGSLTKTRNKMNEGDLINYAKKKNYK
jgi:hypothetical protein